MLCFLRLLAFFPAPSASPLPLPPASLLYRLHPLASPCIPLRPLASPCIGLHLQHLPWGVGVSGCRVGSGCRGVGTARVSGCRLGVSALPLPLPLQLAPRQREWGFDNPTFFSFTLQLFEVENIAVLLTIYPCKQFREDTPLFVSIIN